MATVDDAYEQLWHALNANVAMNTDAGLFKAWQVHYPAWGSPLKDEFTTDDGVPTQVFANAIVQWQDDGPHVITAS